MSRFPNPLSADDLSALRQANTWSLHLEPIGGDFLSCVRAYSRRPPTGTDHATINSRAFIFPHHDGSLQTRHRDIPVAARVRDSDQLRWTSQHPGRDPIPRCRLAAVRPRVWQTIAAHLRTDDTLTLLWEADSNGGWYITSGEELFEDDVSLHVTRPRPPASAGTASDPYGISNPDGDYTYFVERRISTAGTGRMVIIPPAPTPSADRAWAQQHPTSAARLVLIGKRRGGDYRNAWDILTDAFGPQEASTLIRMTARSNEFTELDIDALLTELGATAAEQAPED